MFEIKKPSLFEIFTQSFHFPTIFIMGMGFIAITILMYTRKNKHKRLKTHCLYITFILLYGILTTSALRAGSDFAYVNGEFNIQKVETSDHVKQVYFKPNNHYIINTEVPTYYNVKKGDKINIKPLSNSKFTVFNKHSGKLHEDSILFGKRLDISIKQ